MGNALQALHRLRKREEERSGTEGAAEREDLLDLIRAAALRIGLLYPSGLLEALDAEEERLLDEAEEALNASVLSGDTSKALEALRAWERAWNEAVRKDRTTRRTA